MCALQLKGTGSSVLHVPDRSSIEVYSAWSFSFKVFCIDDGVMLAAAATFSACVSVSAAPVLIAEAL